VNIVSNGKRKSVKSRQRTKIRAIADKCLDCSGDSPKEVTLCQVVECPLWEYRTGNHLTTRSYQARMTGAIERCPVEVEEIISSGVSKVAFFANLGANISRRFHELPKCDKYIGEGK